MYRNRNRNRTDLEEHCKTRWRVKVMGVKVREKVIDVLTGVWRELETTMSIS